MNPSKSHPSGESTFASRTSPSTAQSLEKSVPVPTQEEFQNIFSTPSKKNKKPDKPTNPTKTEKRSIENSLHGLVFNSIYVYIILPFNLVFFKKRFFLFFNRLNIA